MLVTLMASHGSVFSPFGLVFPPGGLGNDASLLFGNDAFGLPLVEEWDDLRTFSICLDVDIGSWSALIGYDSYTRRAEDPAEHGSRLDSLDLGLGYRFRWAKTRGDFSMRLSAGLLLAGDLLGYEMQQLFHGTVSQMDRPIPATYEYGQPRAAPFCAIDLGTEYRNGHWRLEGRALAQADLFGRFGMGGSLFLGYGDAASPFRLGALYHHVSNPDALGEVMGTVHAAEEGLWLADVFMGRYLGFCALYNPFTDMSTGFLSFSLDGGTELPYGRLVFLEVGLHPARSALQVRYRIAGRKSLVSSLPLLRPSVFLERASGWVLPPHETLPTSMGRRFFLVRLGGELDHPLVTRHIRLFVGIGAGMQFDSAYTLDPEHARRLDSVAGLSIAAEGGLRVFPFLDTRLGMFGISCSYLIENDARDAVARGMLCVRIICANGTAQ